LTVGDKVYQCKTKRLYKLSLGEAIGLQRLTGLTISDWRLGLLTWDRYNADVVLGVVWLLKTRAGEPVHMDQINMLDVEELLAGFDWTDDYAEMQAELQEMFESRGAARTGEQPSEQPIEQPAAQ
jgi:hypothetical protein